MYMKIISFKKSASLPPHRRFFDGGCTPTRSLLPVITGPVIVLFISLFLALAPHEERF
jgi:hypothetical protein